MKQKEYVIGNKYNRLTILEEIEPITKYKRRFRCICECGNESLCQLYNLKSGNVQSCGCYNRDKNILLHTTHGMRGTKEYKSYRKMIERCYYEKDINYHNYGGRGIIVCERWRNSFENFFEDMGVKPSPKHTIERKDPNRNYEPDNCIWATSKQQNNNRTNNTRYQYDGLDMTQAQWAEYLGIPSRFLPS